MNDFLELKEYSINELKSLFNSRTRSSLQSKLKTYGITFNATGRGDNTIYAITKISSPLRLHLVFRLGFSSNCELNKLRDFLYIFLNDVEFAAMPDEVMETRMRKMGYTLSRQTIAKYKRRLLNLEYFSCMSGDYIYYFAHENTQIITEKDEYSNAWSVYWNAIEMGKSSGYAMQKVINIYGGVPRKQLRVYENVIYRDDIEYLNNLIIESIENEIK